MPLVVGAVPVLVALIAAGSGGRLRGPRPGAATRSRSPGIALVARSGGSGASATGDLLVLASVAMSAAFIVAQPSLLAGRDAAAVTAVQLAAGALFALPIAALLGGAPPIPAGTAPLAAVVALALAGTLLPFWLFAFGQSRVPAELAGAFVNLEPVVGAAAGWLVLGESAGPASWPARPSCCSASLEHDAPAPAPAADCVRVAAGSLIGRGGPGCRSASIRRQDSRRAEVRGSPRRLCAGPRY
jgi:drug/metabolite transporter (DMT)-like permease